MLTDAKAEVFSSIQLCSGYTDYPRSIIIREEFYRSMIDTNVCVNLLK